jgi:AAA15 family ATPase/GTPase
MLKEFSFRNCRSFKDESKLSLEANQALKDNIHFVAQRGEGELTRYLNPVTAIYGSNAGGKTNLLRALHEATENIHVGLGLRNANYMYDSDSFMHRLSIICGDLEYEYEYTANNSPVLKVALVLKESLWVQDLSAKSGRKEIFVREGANIKSSIYKKGDPHKGFLEKMAANEEALVMKMAGEVGLEYFKPFYRWCGSVVFDMRDLGENKRHDVLKKYATELHTDKQKYSNFKDFTNFMIKFDPSINSLSTITDAPPADQKKEAADSEAKHGARFLIWHTKMDNKDKVSKIPFLVESASNGSKKLMELYPSIKNALEEGIPFVCDELDTLLHPLVFKQIVTMFNDKEYNPNGAQLIFTAHNTIVMNRECLRRDEIHFVDKDEYGKSSVFRLSDVVDDEGNKLRMDARYDRLYMAGFFGAIPARFRDAAIGKG